MIRKATPYDFDVVMSLYKKGLEEIGITDYKESYLLNKVVVSYHLAPCFLVVINDSIVGIAGLTIVHNSHNGDASLADYMFYIEPEHRNIKTLGALVKSAQEFADSHKLPLRIDFAVNGDEETRKRLMKMNNFDVKSIVGIYNG